jgi:hypothetical protein
MPAKINTQTGTAAPANNAAPKKNGRKPMEKNDGPSYAGTFGSSSGWAPVGRLTCMSIGVPGTRVIFNVGQTLVKSLSTSV